MITIHKHTLGPGLNIIDLPADAQILDVQIQHEDEGAQMWCLLDPDSPKIERRFVTYETGHSIEIPQENLKYRGTFQLNGGSWIYHIFEIISESSRTLRRTHRQNARRALFLKNQPIK